MGVERENRASIRSQRDMISKFGGLRAGRERTASVEAEERLATPCYVVVPAVGGQPRDPEDVAQTQGHSAEVLVV